MASHEGSEPAGKKGSRAGVAPARERVRVITLWRADTNSYCFETFKDSRYRDELDRDPNIEACFFSSATDLAQWMAMHAAGSVRILKDQTLKHEILEDWPFLAALAGGPSYAGFGLFRVGGAGCA